MYMICYSESNVIDMKSEFEDFSTVVEFCDWYRLRKFDGEDQTIVFTFKKEKKE